MPKDSAVFSVDWPRAMVWVLMTKNSGDDCGPDHGHIKVQTKEPVSTIWTVPVMARPLRKAAPLGLVLDAPSPTPLPRRIGEQVRRAILERRLAPGQRLPSSRLMASGLEVGGGTVRGGLDQLSARRRAGSTPDRRPKTTATPRPCRAAPARPCARPCRASASRKCRLPSPLASP